MRCTKCGTDNAADARFCNQCATPLNRLCPQCAHLNAADAKFCSQCAVVLGGQAAVGSDASASPLSRGSVRLGPEAPDASAALDGERKTVTALFADIKGSTELMEDLDPEEARAIIDPALTLMMDAVHRYDGYVVQSTGDGIFALFGAPVAHEDHPQRALYAALRLQEELERYSAKLREAGNLPIEGRVGVNTGEVVVRSITTGAGQTEYTPIGHTTNLASRMQALAPTGSIAVSEQTRKLVEGYFQLKPLGPTKVKGVSEPVNVYEVTGLGPLRTRLQRAAGRGLTKFVGREREMEALKHAAEQAKGGRGQIVAAMAEPGVGKSRLFFEFKATSQSGWMVLETFSVSHGKASAYLPVIDLLRNYFDISAADDERKRREKVAGKITILDRSLEDTLPYLFSLLGFVEGDDPLAQMDGQIKKRRTLEAIKRIALRESLNQPLMVIFEDLHWIDEQTQELLNLLADSIGTAKFLLLVNYRPEYSHHWSNKTYYTQLRLDPLGKDSAEQMLSALLGEGVEVRPLKHLIIERTQGNPFFMEETVQVLLDEGALVRNGTTRLTKPFGELKIPPTVQAILAARIDRLAPAEKDLLQTLAVLGREFSFSLVRQVAAKGDDDLERMLSDLQLAEFIYEQPATGDIEYIFKHALTQEVTYNSILVERRKLLHERAGLALESIFAAQLDEYLDELAHHYERSANFAKAVHYLRLSARRMSQQGLLAEGMAQGRRALNLLEKLPDSPERTQEELDLHIALVLATSFSQGFGAADVVALHERTVALSRRVGDNRKLFGILSMICGGRCERGEIASAYEMLDEIRAVAERTGDMGYVSAASVMAVYPSVALGRLAHACAYADQSVTEYDRGGQAIDAWILRPDVLGLHLGGLALWPFGYPDKALVRAADALARARSLDPLNRACSLHVVAEVCAYRGELARAFEANRDELEICRRYGIGTSILGGAGHALTAQGWLLTLRGEFAEGLAELRRGIEMINGSGQKYYVPGYLGRLAIGCLAASDVRAASEMIAQAIGLADETGERAWDAELRQIEGAIALKQGRSEEAARAFREAIEVAQAQSAKSWELLATMSLARLLDKQGKRDEARTMLAEIYGWFTEGFDTADLKDAKTLLDELGDN